MKNIFDLHSNILKKWPQPPLCGATLAPLNRLFARKGTKINKQAARASVFRSVAVETQTTIIQFRMRNVIREVSKQNEMVSEEMFLWGYAQTPDGINTHTRFARYLGA
jgi:uncharacterized protein YccT (UPF0319 family)